MSSILPVLCFSTADAPQADALLSYIFELNGRMPRKNLLLVSAQDAHAELTAKLKISAEIAFENVEVLKVNWPTIPSNAKWPNVNHAFRETAAFMNHANKWPWLFIEPDCVPLKSDWLEQIEDAYDATPKRYMGSILAPKGKDAPERCLDRVAVYPVTAFMQMATLFDAQEPFQFLAGANIVPRSQKSRLFQWLRYTATTERSKVNPEAVILHGDKEGILLQSMREELKKAPTKIFDLGDGLQVSITEPAKPQSPALLQMPPGTATLAFLDAITPEENNYRPPIERKPGRPRKILPAAIND